jgi:hypothetical protein
MTVMEKLLQIWPTTAALAQDLGLPYQTVAAWKDRGIPARRAPAIVHAARSRGHVLTLDDLLMPPPKEEDAA